MFHENKEYMEYMISINYLNNIFYIPTFSFINYLLFLDNYPATACF